ncbi:hypothetical protein HanIR_Chr16g0787161 [Helianthus annuus]|nr:hypothetical protein HanIR_Chr16g0787161 [Helianthus annuus]
MYSFNCTIIFSCNYAPSLLCKGLYKDMYYSNVNTTFSIKNSSLYSKHKKYVDTCFTSTGKLDYKST